MTPATPPAPEGAARTAVPLRLCHWLDQGLVWLMSAIAVGSIVALFLTILAEVGVRYLTNSSLGWPTELPNLLFPWLVMSSIVLAAQLGQHIAVDVGLRLTGPTSSRWVLIAMSLLAAAAFLYLAYTGLRILEVTRTERFPLMRLPMVYAYFAIVAGFLLLAVTALTTAVRTWYADLDPFAARTTSEILQ